MPEPVPQKVYRNYSFTNFQTTKPATPLPGQSVDNELDRSDNTINDVIDFVRQAIADDGTIRPDAAESLIGPEGPQGPIGPQGPQGFQGQRGPQGVPGVDGAEGPQGVPGPEGEMFTPDKVGPLSLRVNYDAEPSGFSYLAEDVSTLYFKVTDASGDWSEGTTFGAGPQGPQGPPGPSVVDETIAAPGKPTPDNTDVFGYLDTTAVEWVKASWFNLKEAMWYGWGAINATGPTKGSMVDADSLTVTDSQDAEATKRLTFGNLAIWVRGILGPQINAAVNKPNPVDADQLGIADSAAANATKQVTLTQLWANYLVAKLNAAYLALTGGTLTGNLTINKNAPDLILNKTGSSATISGQLNGVYRWRLFLGDGTAEGGANSGSQFAINRYSDAGAQLATAFSIDRATGAALFSTNSLILDGGAASASLQVKGAGASGIELGRQDGVASTPYMDFHSGATLVDYDARLIATGGTGVAGGGGLQLIWTTSTGQALATAAQYRGNTAGKLLDTSGVWAAAVYVSIAYAASITLNLANGINFRIDPIAGALALQNPTNQKSGQSGFIWLGGVAGQAITFGTAFYFPPGGKPTVMGTNLDVLWYQCLDGATLVCSYVKNYNNA